MRFNHHSTVCCWSVMTAVGLDLRRRLTSASTGSFQHTVCETSLCSMILIGPNLASLVLQRDGVNMAAIVRLAQMHRAAVAVEAFDEFAAHFVTVLADQRADGGDDAAWFGAELFHRLDGGFQNA